MTGVSVGEDETARTILATFNETGELVDPHTAVALAAAARTPPIDTPTPMIVLSTAHPAKFPDTVEAAAGVTPVSLGAIEDKPERFERIAADAEAAKAFIRGFAKR
jgi:threonine synthase